MLLAAASISLSLVVMPVRILDRLPDGRVHIVCNTGEKLETEFDYAGARYRLVNCDLSPGRYIDTICDLVRVD